MQSQLLKPDNFVKCNVMLYYLFVQSKCFGYLKSTDLLEAKGSLKSTDLLEAKGSLKSTDLLEAKGSQ